MTNIYSLEFLLDRTFKELNERDLNKYNKLIIPKPDVIYVNRKTLFKNFREVCYKLNRKENDVKLFLDTELSTSSSIDINGYLVINGNFKQVGIQKILGQYIKEFILCRQCNSSETEIMKENRITFLNCLKCLSKTAI